MSEQRKKGKRLSGTSGINDSSLTSLTQDFERWNSIIRNVSTANQSTDNQSTQINFSPHDAKTRRALRSIAVSTTTPPNTVLDTRVLQNAPLKRRTATNKFNLRPKKLFVESDITSMATIDSGFETNLDKEEYHRYPTRNRPEVSKTNNKVDGTNVATKKTKGNDKAQINRNGKKKLTNIDKENDQQMANLQIQQQDLASNSSIFQKQTVQSSSSRNCQNFEESNEPVLSQCNSNDNPNEILRWLQPRRDVGLYVQCSRKTCGKWRYTDDYHDPVDVPEKWFCEMNSDLSVASCHSPQRPIPTAIEQDLIENKYNAGSIVWARLNGFPWWPAMVDDCPETFRYYGLRRNSNVPYQYHVTFFSDDENIVERSWIINRDLKPFVRNPRASVVKKTVFKKIEYKSRLDKACKVAETAVQLPLYERLKTFSFIEQIARIKEKQTSLELDNEERSRAFNPEAPEMLTISINNELQVNSIGSSSEGFVGNSQMDHAKDCEKLINLYHNSQIDEELVTCSHEELEKMISEDLSSSMSMDIILDIVKEDGTHKDSLIYHIDNTKSPSYCSSSSISF